MKSDKIEFDLVYKATNYRVFYLGEEYYLYQEWDESDGGGSGSIEISFPDGEKVPEELENIIKEEYYK